MLREHRVKYEMFVRVPSTIVRSWREPNQIDEIVLTVDLDFGELAFRVGLPPECGVVLIGLDWAFP
jgi:hypothetical protein